ncbi:MAG: pantoate--beta-alanine ligase [Clostridium sp.]|nr:pantoate--beta-alanine ligase [Clostridium sp.]MCM1547266.1 pantoate--beta-alanine ligase [Ruminococcus sp.]
MKIAKTIKEVREIVSLWKKQGLTIGLVPTMGYLHEGHQSLIERSGENDRTVVSIFVNPIQFGPNEDFASYPRDLERDTKKCGESGADLIFAPDAEEMYADDFSSFVDMTGPVDDLCGAKRPGHFRGVCTVVAKLFNIVAPDRAYFGQKDAQQLAVIKRMTRDLSFGIEIVGCPIVREADGLAKSSRNTYLSDEERRAAVVISKALAAGQTMISGGETSAAAVTDKIRSLIESEPLAEIDYIKAVNADSIEPVDTIKGRTLVAAAVYIGKTRLIDNFIAERN